ncbi:integrase-like protein [Pseudomonas duriflava]|uniref:Integrase-like protein n=1 Tax=Pseudomonas duriflava TaxID=459528 RepID=A0A562PLM5_9PSED|nr:integrase-like protein [Pseudomonas duriflava]
MHTAEGRAYLFVAIERTSKFVYAELHEQMMRKNAVSFLEATLKTLPYKAHTALIDNGIQFAKKIGSESYWAHPFDRVCHQQGIEHRLTKPFHPWTNDQVERMNRTIKQATTKAFHCASLKQLQDL